VNSLDGFVESDPNDRSKDQDKARHEIRSEAGQVDDVQKEGWGDRVSFLLLLLHESRIGSTFCQIEDILGGDDEKRQKEEEDLRLRTKHEEEARRRIEEQRGLLDKVIWLCWLRDGGI
jgi:hypothetical protein